MRFASGPLIIVVIAVTSLTLFRPKEAEAQHGDYLLGTNGMLAAQQAPEGLFYSNSFSYYNASGSSFFQTGSVKCGPFGKLCLAFNASADGSLDLFVDQNIIGWEAPFSILGGHYGLLSDLPFAIADAKGAASLEPVLNTSRASHPLPTLQSGGGSIKGSIGDMYVEPVNFGWHFRQLDAILSSGFFAPSGPYNSNAKLNIGYGHWTGVFGLGGVAYADAKRTWSLSLYAHYLLYGSQMGRNYTLGDAIPFEWGTGKTLNLHSEIFKEVTIGAVGYVQWQVTNNQINLSPTSNAGQSLLNQLESAHAAIYAAGPAIQALTKYGLFNLRYYDEFDTHATPSGKQLMFGVAF